MIKRDAIDTGDMIREMRERAGMSKTELARWMLTSVVRIKQLEEQKDCKVSTLVEVAAACGYKIRLSKDE